MLAALALLALLIPVPGAQAAPFFIEMTGTIESPVPIPDLELRAGSNPGNPAGPCNQNFFTGDDAQSRFRFAEGSDSNGCLSVVYPFIVPDGVRRVGVSFLADRVMQDSTRAVNLGPPAFEQEIRLRVDEAVLAVSPYFDPQQEDQASRPVSIAFDVPTGASDIEIEWWFANRADGPATSDPSAGRFQAWSATIAEPAILLEGIPLGSPALRENRGQVEGESYLTGYTADIAVPAEHQAAAADGRFALQLRMPATVLLDRLLAPSGNDLHDEEYDTAILGSSRLITLQDATLARHGPGPYVIRFQGSEPLHIEPSMAVLTGMAFLMPPIAILLAVRQLRRRSLDTYVEATDALEGELAPR